MNEKELLELLAEQAPLPPADYPMTTLMRARRVRRMRALAIGGGTMAVVVLLLLMQVVLRPSGGPSLPPAQSEPTHTGVVYLKEATAEERSAVRSMLDATAGISKVTLVTREDAYDRFVKMFKDSPDLVAAVGPAEMPESYEFEASATADRRDLLYRLRDMHGVAFAASPVPHEISAGVSPSPGLVPEMGLPEAQVYGEQLILLAAAVWQRPARPQTVYLVDGFCPHATEARSGCTLQRFSPLLRSELQRLVSDYAAVVFVEGPDHAVPVAQDALVVSLGPLASHHTGNQTLWLDMRSAEHSEYAGFEVAWDGERWVVGQWTAGSVSTTSP